MTRGRGRGRVRYVHHTKLAFVTPERGFLEKIKELESNEMMTVTNKTILLADALILDTIA